MDTTRIALIVALIAAVGWQVAQQWRDTYPDSGRIADYEGDSLPGTWSNLWRPVRHGQGKQLYPNGHSYEGAWERDARQGHGFYMFNDGGFYRGGWVQNMRQGRGDMVWGGDFSGTRYSGHWFADKRHGKGRYSSKDPSAEHASVVYDGDFVADLRHGQGRMEFPDGSKYEGAWLNDQRSGHGILKFPDGSEYDGEWHEDLQHGSGIITGPDGSSWEGTWHFNQRHGKGTVRQESGLVMIESYEDGFITDRQIPMQLQETDEAREQAEAVANRYATMQEMLAWMNEHGARFDGVSVIPSGVGTEFQLISSAEISNSSTVMLIPRKLVLSPAVAAADEVIAQAITRETSPVTATSESEDDSVKRDVRYVLHESEYTAFFMILARARGKKSFWHSYLKSLPWDMTSWHPIHYSDDELELLNGTYSVQHILEVRQRHQESFQELCSRLHDIAEAVQVCEDHSGQSLYTSALLMLSSRRFALNPEDSEPFSPFDEDADDADSAASSTSKGTASPCFVPLADMANHASADQAEMHWGYNVTLNAFRMSADRHLTPGMELRHSYSKLVDNAVFWSGFGFALDYNHRANSALVPIQVQVNDDDGNLNNVQVTRIVYPSIFRKETLLFLSFIRSAFDPETADPAPPIPALGKEDTFDIGVRSDASKRLVQKEIFTWTRVYGLVSVALSQFNTTMEEDFEHIKDVQSAVALRNSLPDDADISVTNLIAIVRRRMEEKAVLHWFAGYAATILDILGAPLPMSMKYSVHSYSWLARGTAAMLGLQVEWTQNGVSDEEQGERISEIGHIFDAALQMSHSMETEEQLQVFLQKLEQIGDRLPKIRFELTS